MTASPRVQILDVKAVSDADPSHRPNGWSLVDPPHLYLEKLAMAWLRDQNIKPLPHMRYYLNRLPEGYAVFERPRPSNPRVIDKYLFGHPKHKFFDSPNRFVPHFLHLMRHGSNNGCDCAICKPTDKSASPLANEMGIQPPSQPRPAPQPQSHSQPHTRLPAAVLRTKDEEQTPDMVRWLIDRLKQEKGTIDQPIQEPLSMDWRAEHALLNQELSATASQHAWLPRKAEIVLFVRHLKGEEEICLDANSQTFKIFNNRLNEFQCFPRWEAGVIGQTPEETQSLDGLVVDTGKDEKSPVFAGFRVEPLPDPNNFVQKEWTKRHVYVPLRQIRPFNFWSEYIAGIADSQRHVTISHALKCMSSFALIGRSRFKGSWPHATVFHRGLQIGAELITVGDAVRVQPNAPGDHDVTVMVISSIRLQLSDLDAASANDYDSGNPYNSMVEVVGRAYTTTAQKAFDADSPCDSRLLPPGMQGYGPWWLVHPGERLYSVPFNRILGRCYEANAMKLWHPGSQDLLGIGLDGVRSSRASASLNDSRIARGQGKTWFWADSRAELLGILSLNNVAVDAWAGTRSEDDLDEQRHAINVLEKGASKADRQRMLEEKKKRGIAQVAAAGKMGASRVATQEAQDEEEFIIEKLLNKRDKDGETQYEVQWLGWEETTWEPAAMLLEDVPEMVQEYERKHEPLQNSAQTTSLANGESPPSDRDQVEADYELAKRLQQKEQEDEYTIERLLRKRKQPRTGVWEYQVRWQGWNETTWEPASTLQADVPELVEQFERSMNKTLPIGRSSQSKAESFKGLASDSEAAGEHVNSESGTSGGRKGSMLAAFAYQSPKPKRKRSVDEHESNHDSKRERVHNSSSGAGSSAASSSGAGSRGAPSDISGRSSSSSNSNVGVGTGMTKNKPISLDGTDERLLKTQAETLDDSEDSSDAAGEDLLAGWVKNR